MAFTREDWARGFLAALGNSNPSPQVVDWVVGWTTHETTAGGGALYNLLNTTQQASDSTFYNYLNPPQDTFGVQDYTSFAEGVQENAAVLAQNHPGYATLLQALQSNDIGTLQSSAVSQGLNTWGTHSAGANPAALTAQGAAHLSDSFSYGNATGGISPQDTTSPTSSSGLCSSVIAQFPLSPIYLFCKMSGSLGGVIDSLTPNAQAFIGVILTLFKTLLIFAAGALLVVIGIYLLVQPDISSVAGQVMAAASSSEQTEGAGEGEREGEPSPSPAPTTAEGQRQAQQQSSKKQHASKKQELTEAAEMAAMA